MDEKEPLPFSQRAYLVADIRIDFYDEVVTFDNVEGRRERIRANGEQLRSRQEFTYPFLTDTYLQESIVSEVLTMTWNKHIVPMIDEEIRRRVQKMMEMINEPTTDPTL